MLSPGLAESAVDCIKRLKDSRLLYMQFFDWRNIGTVLLIMGNRRNISEQAVKFFETSARRSLFELDRWINDPYMTACALELNIFTTSQIMPPRMPCQKSKKSTMEKYIFNNYGQSTQHMIVMESGQLMDGGQGRTRNVMNIRVLMGNSMDNMVLTHEMLSSFV